jgi:antirestriction protein ArdC
MTTKKPFDVYTAVTNRIIAAIEADPGEARLPWHRSGLSTMLPKNALTGKSYNGINILSLWAEAQLRVFPYAVWGTYKQWLEVGAQVRKGERSSLVVFYKDYEVDPNPDVADDDGRRRVAKASFVFNAAQVDGYTAAEPLPPMPALERNAIADALIAATGANIQIGGESAYYRPSTDHIQMPDENLFRESDTGLRTQDWYAVLTHELGHWSGAKARLAREFGKRFGDNAYCVEELTAELVSAMLCTELGITSQPRADHAHYIAHYLTLMKADKRAVFAAAAKAAEACAYLKSLQATA